MSSLTPPDIFLPHCSALEFVIKVLFVQSPNDNADNKRTENDTQNERQIWRQISNDLPHVCGNGADKIFG